MGRPEKGGDVHSRALLVDGTVTRNGSKDLPLNVSVCVSKIQAFETSKNRNLFSLICADRDCLL